MAELIVVGTPLNEESPLSPQAAEAIAKASVIVGENRKLTFRYTKPHWNKDKAPEMFFLDPLPKDEKEFLEEALQKLAETEESVVLLSDTGMPILFDPGALVLEQCRKLKYQIRTVPSATSWGTACSLSGWEPPFNVVGFLNREAQERTKQLNTFGKQGGHLVLMDTPYRFEALISSLAASYGPKRQVFLAWEISNPTELYFWGTIQELQQFTKTKNLTRGEFVLIIHA